MKKRIIAVLSLVLCLALCLFACGKSVDAEIELVKWKAPSYDDTYYVGEEIRLKTLTVEDENGNEYEAVITVKSPDPENETIVKKKASGSFTPEIAGDYTVYYAILTEDGEEEIAKKTTTITVVAKNNNNNNGGNGGNSGGNGGSSTTLSIASQFGTPVAWGNNNEVSVSGNKITVNKKVAESAYAGMAFQNLNFTVSDPEQQVTLTVKNNTGSSVKAKYKATTNGTYKPSWGNTGEGFGAEDVIASANATASKSFHVLTYDQKDTANKITQVEIYIITDATSGTIEIGLTLGSSSGGNGGGNTTPTPTDPRDAHTKSVLGAMKVQNGSDNYFSVSGTTITVKNKTYMPVNFSGAENEYKSIKWDVTSSYSASTDKSISFTVTNNTGATISLKYKVTSGDAIYVDFNDIPVGESNVATNIGGVENKTVLSLSQIEIFIENTTGRGTIDILPKLSNEVIKYGNDINIENPTGATISADKQSAEEGETVTLSYNLTNAEAYEFGGFKVNGTAIDGNTFIMPDEDVTVSATVNKVKNIITITQTNAGTITATVEGANVTAAAQGVEVTLNVINIKEGYALNEFKVNGNAIDGNTFTMPNSDVTVSATYTQTAYYVIVNQPSNGGSITVTANGNAVGNVPFDNGTEITLSNTPNANYKFVKYVVNGADTTESSLTINGRDLTISAVFEQNVFTITKTNPTGATINAPATAEKGTTVTLDYSLSDNYTFDGWTVKDASGNTITVNNNQFTMPSSNVTVTANVKLLSATATVTKVGKYDEISYTNTTSSVTITGTSGSNDLYHSAEISLSNTEGQNKITFTVTNDSASSVTVYVWVATETNNRHSNGISIQSVTGATKGNGSGHDIAQQTVVAGGSTQITITLSSAMTSGSALRVTPYMGGTLTVSDFIIGG